MSRKFHKPRRSLPPWKKALFGVVACVGIVGLIEAALAALGVKPMRYESDPYVGFSGRLPLFVRQGNQMVTADNKRRIFNFQQFPAKKARNAFRIFCIGGSTTYGHPYTDSTSFCGWLRAMLPKADPTRQWELINCGGVSYASYREALLMEELSNYEPDLFIILSGHNEFLEQRTYGEIIRTPEVVRGADAVLGKTRTYAALKRTVKKPAPAANVLSAEVDTMLDHTIGPQAYHRDDAVRKQIVDHFKFNLARMADIARSAGAQIMLVTPAVNLRNCAPFKSEHRAGITPAEIAEWQRLVRHATQQHRTTNWAEAVSALHGAVTIDPRFADGHYLLGHALWESYRFNDARAAFTRALEEDVCPLRALPEMIEDMREIAAQRRIPVVDFVKLLESRSAYGTPGEDWFLDHVHPTIEGHRLLALALIEKMAEHRWVRPVWTTSVQEEIKRAIESSVTSKDHGIALCTLAKVIAWAGKDAEAHKIAVRARSLAPEDAAVHFEVGKNAARIGKHDEAIAALKQAVSLQPKFPEAKALLGTALLEAGQTNEALRSGREAAQLRPDDARLRLVVAGLLSRGNHAEEAIAECREALKLSPNYAEAHNTLGWLLKDERQYTEALRHFREAVRARPGLTPAKMGVAWLLATHPDPKIRNPREAIDLSEELVELSRYQSWLALDTLAAAYAAGGRFKEAVETQTKALALVRNSNVAEAPAVEARLALYKEEKSFSEN